MSHPSTPRANGAGPERGEWLSLATYAEERDTWTPSHRARVDGYMSAARVRVRLDDGGETIATWNGDDKCWFAADGEPIGDPHDVTHVWLGPVRTSGPSGRHSSLRRKLSASAEAWELMAQAMLVDRETSWAVWARTALAEAVADRLGLNVLDTVALFEAD